MSDLNVITHERTLRWHRPTLTTPPVPTGGYFAAHFRSKSGRNGPFRGRKSGRNRYCGFNSMGEELRPFQRSVVAALRNDLFLIVAISLARGNGKSWLAGWAVARILDPADELFRAATESVLCAASIDQARIVFRFAREMLEPLGGYKFLDSAMLGGAGSALCMWRRTRGCG